MGLDDLIMIILDSVIIATFWLAVGIDAAIKKAQKEKKEYGQMRKWWPLRMSFIALIWLPWLLIWLLFFALGRSKEGSPYNCLGIG
jgi:hypothetical protein